MAVELSETIDKMVSPDYKTRMVAEYQQLLIRWNKLETFLDSLTTEEFAGQKKLLQAQDLIMVAYMNLLKIRAEIENITLE